MPERPLTSSKENKQPESANEINAVVDNEVEGERPGYAGVVQRKVAPGRFPIDAQEMLDGLWRIH